MSLFQFDPANIVPMYGAVAAAYLLLDRRLRRMEQKIERLNTLAEEEKADKK